MSWAPPPSRSGSPLPRPPRSPNGLPGASCAVSLAAVRSRTSIGDSSPGVNLIGSWGPLSDGLHFQVSFASSPPEVPLRE
eukprot:1186519-Pyramimonas_sp.AAC.1